MGLDSGVCSFYDQIELDSDELKVLSKRSFVYRKVTYNVNDFLYIRLDFFSEDEDRATFKAGRNVGLKPYAVCQILAIPEGAGSKKLNPASANISARRFYRPDDISSAKAYTSDIREVFFFYLIRLIYLIHNVIVTLFSQTCVSKS